MTDGWLVFAKMLRGKDKVDDGWTERSGRLRTARQGRLVGREGG